MSIESVMHENRVFAPSAEFVKSANVSGMAAYHQLCAEASADYQGFWAKLARELLVWNKPFTKTLNEDNAPFYRWFEDGELNVSVNCLDKHLKTIPNKVAIIFEADSGDVKKVTYKKTVKWVNKKTQSRILCSQSFSSECILEPKSTEVKSIVFISSISFT